jgi:hypothetical protein
MSTSRDGLLLFMETYLAHEPWTRDPTLVPLPWRQIKLSSRLKIGIMWDDGVVTPRPPIRRALRQVCAALMECSGRFQAVDWAPVDHDRCGRISMSLYFEDGCRAIKQVLEEGGESPRPLTSWIFQSEDVKYRTIEEVWDVSGRRLVANTDRIDLTDNVAAESSKERLPPGVQ